MAIANWLVSPGSQRNPVWLLITAPLHPQYDLQLLAVRMRRHQDKRIQNLRYFFRGIDVRQKRSDFGITY